MLLGDYKPKNFPLTYWESVVPKAGKWIALLHQLQEEAQSTLELAWQCVKERITWGFRPFKLNNLVWLKGKNLKTLYESKKIAPKCKGPFKIINVLKPLTYQLKLPTQWKIHPIFHVNLLTPFRETNVHGPNYLKLSPDLINKEEKYKVEAIIAHQKHGRWNQYLIKWKGYPMSGNS